jgi:hypothetical protein
MRAEVTPPLVGWLCVEERPPKWHPNLRPTFDKMEQDYVTRSINRIVEAQSRPKGFAPPPNVHHSDLGNFTDGELLHMLLGVQS